MSGPAAHAPARHGITPTPILRPTGEGNPNGIAARMAAVRDWRPQLTLRHTLLIALTGLLIAFAIRSLAWRAGPEVARMLFAARMIDQHGLLPYRDLFDLNAPGAFYAHILIGRLTGYTDGPGLRWFDLAYLAAILLVTWAWLRRLGGTVGWAAAVLFGLSYLSLGPSSAILEPEYLILLPLAAALMVAVSFPRLRDAVRCGLVGLLFGVIATITPQAVLALAAVGVFLWLDIRDRRGPLAHAQVAGLIGAGLAGLALPILAAGVFLAATGTLGDYGAILTQYGPIHAGITANGDILAGPEQVSYRITALLNLGKQQLWLAPAGVGLLLAVTVSELGRRATQIVWLAAGLAVCGIAYVSAGGEFQPTHWLLFVYFCVSVAAACFLPVRDARAGAFLRALPLGVLIVTLALRRDVVPSLITESVGRSAEGQAAAPPVDASSADALADYLRATTLPGDRIQPLGSDSLRAMLLTNSPPATRFTDDSVFLADAATPAVQALRAEFLASLAAQPPRFVVYVPGYRFNDGPDASRNFPGLQKLIDQRYALAYVGQGFRVYERGSAAEAGLIVYGMPWPPKPDGYLRAPAASVIGLSGGDLADVAALDAKLSAFAAGRQRLTLEVSQTDSAEVGPLETWLKAHAHQTSDVRVGDARVVAYLVAAP